MKMDTFWEESLGHRLKVERNLNFSTITNEDDEFGFSRKKTARIGENGGVEYGEKRLTQDPMSHRIIEKRRRDRMNNCLADLSRLVPTNYMKKGRGRIEKTEIIEMAIKHLKHLQAHPCKNPATCEVAKTTEQNHKHQYRLGYQECMSETVRFLVEIEGFYASDGLCVRLVSHLQKHYDKVSGGMCYTQALGMMHAEESDLVPMDAEQSSSGFLVEGYGENGVHHPDENLQSQNTTDERSSPMEGRIKQEISVVHTTQNDFQEHLESAPENSVASKVLTQLSNMIQLNASSVRDSPQTTRGRICSSEHSEPLVGNGVVYSVESALSEQAHKIDEVYKFKNNIKHRFNADLRQHTTSPTGSHSDQAWSEEQGHRESQCSPKNTLTSPSVLVCKRYPGVNRNVSFTPSPPLLSESSKEQQSFKCMNMPDKVSSDAHGSQCNYWECEAETGSSHGSNPSPTPVKKQNESISGYSTNGEMQSSSKTKIQTPDHCAPALSPHSRMPDHLPSSQSPSPQPAPCARVGIPIFALHPRRAFYIPLTIDSALVAPYLSDVEEISPILHPISICVNFSPGCCIKPEKVNGTAVNFYSDTLFMDKFHGRYTAHEKHPCSPTLN